MNRLIHQYFMAPAISSLLLLESTVNGFLPPRRTVVGPMNSQRADINLPAESPKDEGLLIDADTGRRALLGAVMSACTVFAPSLGALADDEDESNTTLHIVDYPVQGKCGEAQVPEKGVFFAKTFGGLVEGSCSADGYTSDEGTANGTGDKDKKRTYSIYGK